MDTISLETYKKAAKKAGFDALDVLPLMVSLEALEQMGEAYWRDFLDNPCAAVFRAIKPL